MVVINYKYKIIYFHIPKTAGTYVQNILTQYDFIKYNIATFNLEKYNEYIRKKYDVKNINLFYDDAFENRYFGENYYYTIYPELLNISTEILDSYFKFTIVRNPYSRFISGCNFILEQNLCKKISVIVLEDFINQIDFISNKGYNHIFISQYDHLLNNKGVNNINFIGHYETLEDDLKIILNKCDVDKIIHSPDKQNFTKSNIFSFNSFNQNILDFVNNHFDRDFLEFNYKKYLTIEEFRINHML